VTPRTAARWAPWIAVLVATLWAALDLASTGDYDRLPVAEEHLIAVHLVHGEGFSSPFDASANAGPTSWSPPVYPGVLFLAYRAFGIHSAGASMALAILNALAFALIAGVLVYLARLYLPPLAGAIAVLLYCLHPTMLHYVTDYWDGMLGLAMFISALGLAAFLRQRPASAQGSAALGVLLGVLSLTNAVYAFTYPVLVWSACKEATRRRKTGLSAIALLAFALVLTPWTLRNRAAFGAWFYIRGGAPLELWNGNRPAAPGWADEDGFETPTFNPKERAYLLSVGETAYYRVCGERFRAEVRADPKAFVQRTFVRIVELFVGNIASIYRPRAESFRACLPVGLLSCFGIFGAWFLWRNRRDAGWLIAAALLSVAPYSLTYASDRYALPLRTLLALFSAAPLAALWQKIRPYWRPANADGPRPALR
jgi:4-amino-4-deoxy-L-arabinose transferase-like glycosyltransferase